jgi:AcrR family transcriptional regulator
MASKAVGKKPQPRALRRDAAENRERLIAAAQKVFSALGTEATMEDVARAASVGLATLYRRFPNKDTLVQAVLEHFFRHLIARADDALRRPPEQCVAAYLTTVAHELASKRGLAHGLWGHLAPRALVAELEERTRLLVERARSVGAVAEQFTVGDIAATVWALRGIFQSGGPAADAASRRHVAYLLVGFRAGRPTLRHSR